MEIQEKKQLIIETIKKLDEITIVKTFDKRTKLIGFDEVTEYESYSHEDVKRELYRILGELVYKEEANIENNPVQQDPPATNTATTNEPVKQEE